MTLHVPFCRILRKKEADKVGLSDVTPAGGKEEQQRVTDHKTLTLGKVERVPKRYLGIHPGFGKG